MTRRVVWKERSSELDRQLPSQLVVMMECGFTRPAPQRKIAKEKGAERKSPPLVFTRAPLSVKCSKMSRDCQAKIEIFVFRATC